jgi:phage shock protein A
MVDDDRIVQLERQVDDLKGQLRDVRHQLAAAELDQWQGRIDDLEVQAHLGSMAVRDRLDPVVEDLRNTWLEAKAKLGDGAETTSTVTERLRSGLENAMSEIRSAVLDVRSSVKD